VIFNLNEKKHKNNEKDEIFWTNSEIPRWIYLIKKLEINITC